MPMKTASEIVYYELYEYYIKGETHEEDRVFEKVPISEVIRVVEEYARQFDTNKTDEP